MKIIVGLGNPGIKYEHTRHNAGFLAVDSLQKTLSLAPWQEKKKLLGALAEGIVDGEKIILVKPSVFMNESGRAVRTILDFYKAGPDVLTVIHDDLDIAPGTIKATASSRAAGHNGVADIIDMLGTQDFKRLRIGIGRPAEVLGACEPSHDYVLGKFTSEEQTLLTTTLQNFFQDQKTFLT
jgi:PTH1 family peptidyl-tRNA hydrolase